MSKIYTYHVIGITPEKTYTAMSRAEIAQQLHRAEQAGDKIIEWYAQTETGKRILGNVSPITTGQLPRLPAMVDCPICDHAGCVVCDWSGICRPGHWKRWQPWQLEDIRLQCGKAILP